MGCFFIGARFCFSDSDAGLKPGGAQIPELHFPRGCVYIIKIFRKEVSVQIYFPNESSIFLNKAVFSYTPLKRNDCGP
jgi:hypothetical protein